MIKQIDRVMTDLGNQVQHFKRKECEVLEQPLYRMLRALAGEGVFAEDEDGRFTLTPMAELLRRIPIVNRAILDVLENGKESREAERWLLSRNFEGLQTAFD